MARLVALILVSAAWAQGPSGTLLERLGSADPSERVRAMEEAERLPEEVRAGLAKGLREEKPEVAMRLWRTLGTESRHDAALVAIALRAAGPEGRSTWVLAAKELGVERFLALSPPLPAEILVDLLCSGQVIGPPSTDLLQGEGSRPERPVMREAPPGLDAAIELARHESHLVRASLAWWLADVSGARARGALESLCGDPTPLVRLSAMRALLPRFSERRDMRAFLLPYLTDDSPSVRAESVSRLARIATPATDLVAWVRLSDPDAEVRRVAAGYFVYRKLPWSVPYLVRALALTPTSDAEVIERVIVADDQPRSAVELAARLDVIPRVGMPMALHVLDGMARSAGLPGPSWFPVARESPLPATLRWPDGARATGLRVIASGPVRIRVHVSLDGATWKELGPFRLSQGERIVPMGGAWRIARVSFDSIHVAQARSELLSAATCCPVAGPSDPIAAWRAWAEEARPWLVGPDEKALAVVRRLTAEGKRIDALALLCELLLTRADHPVARLWKAQALVDGSAFDEAGPTLEGLVKDRPRYAPALALLARVREVKEDFAAARELLSRAIEADPAEASYRMRRAALATQAGDHVIALEHLAAAVRVRPEDHILRFDYGYALYSAGRYAEGLGEFRYVVGRDPGSVDARYNIACGLARLGRADEALAALQEAVGAGFHDADFAHKDPDLESIRTDPRFEGVLKGTSQGTEGHLIDE